MSIQISKAFTKIGFKECYEKNNGKIYEGPKKVIEEWINENESHYNV